MIKARLILSDSEDGHVFWDSTVESDDPLAAVEDVTLEALRWGMKVAFALAARDKREG